MIGAGHAGGGDHARGETDDRLLAAGRSELRGERVELTYVEFEILAALAQQPRPRLRPRHAARARLGRQRLPRPAHDRRPHPPPAREDRARRQGARVPVHGARRRLPLPRREARRWTATSERPAPALGGAPRSNSVRTGSSCCPSRSPPRAVGFVYLYVVPQLSSSLTAERLERLEQQGGDELDRLRERRPGRGLEPARARRRSCAGAPPTSTRG